LAPHSRLAGWKGACPFFRRPERQSALWAATSPPGASLHNSITAPRAPEARACQQGNARAHGSTFHWALGSRNGRSWQGCRPAGMDERCGAGWRQGAMATCCCGVHARQQFTPDRVPTMPLVAAAGGAAPGAPIVTPSAVSGGRRRCCAACWGCGAVLEATPAPVVVVSAPSLWPW
jgi:hypothetical protein